MTFTDSDLKQLKEDIPTTPGTKLEKEKLWALLARLEASEKRGDIAIRRIENSTIVKSIGLINSDMAWRKAAGLK